MLDLGQFASLDDALTKVAPGSRYLDVGSLLLPVGDEGLPMTLPIMFWFSMITRSEGLHAAIAREISEGNPHAVVPLRRAFAEAVVLLIYVNDHPGYIQALIARPREQPEGARRRKSIQSLIQYASKHAPGMKDVYADLSEATHFGAIAMWASVSIEGESESGLQPSWASSPRWRSEEQALICCAQTHELADAMQHLLRAFYERHVDPLKRG
jgi:hypothetical protein